MTLELYLAFVLAAGVLVALPGPTTLLITGYSLSGGARAGLVAYLGVALGDATAMTLSFLGVGALLATSATLFTVVKWLGALYLLWLGYRQWRAPTVLAVAGSEPRRRGRMVRDAFIVTALNPKGIIFFVAFMPQFIDPTAAAVPQMLLLGLTFETLAFASVAVYALLAGRLRGAARRPGVLRWFNRLGGAALAGAGVATLALRRGA